MVGEKFDVTSAQQGAVACDLVDLLLQKAASETDIHTV